ncbi:MAG: hypothetical protein ABFD89_20690 [Bryobacteraceae bacterium]|nr:hypothetical protein [bacterium]
MKWITASDLTNWANTKQRHCQETLPELVRRLIAAHTVGALEECDFPSGDSVAIGGWDGRLQTSVVSPFIPTGGSGWEFGTERSSRTKAEKDFRKRTADPLDIDPNEASFVFVTPRTFKDRKSWVAEKKALGGWKDVRVIASSELEEWLDATPAVALWLARQIGKVGSSNIRDLEAFWEEWSTGTEPVLTPALVSAGRIKDARSIQEWLRGKPAIHEVQADHPDEAIAILYAAVAELGEVERGQVLARAAVVLTPGEMRQLVQAFPNDPLVIVGTGECLEIAPAAVARGHHVFLAIDSKAVAGHGIHQLARPDRQVVERLLHEAGLSEGEAQRIARNMGRSIPVLRRHLFGTAAISAPAWASAESARVLLPALFANTWDESKSGDGEVVAALAGTEYEKVVGTLAPFLTAQEAPVRRVGSVWAVSAPIDLWYLLATHLTRDQLTRFESALLAVLSKTNPKYDLEPRKRWAASIYGKASAYSGWLRSGLTESMAILAVYGDRAPAGASTEQFAEYIVGKVLQDCDSWQAWASLSDVSPLLAEAAPDAFLDAVERRIAASPEVFRELMKDDEAGVGFGGECRHCGLLWALESLSWSRDHFGQAVSVLAELAEMDPGGRWGNRPLASLRATFLPGLPQTHATPKQRLEVLKRLITRNPQLVWKFGLGYYSNATISESHRFRWRETGGTRRGLTLEADREYQKYLQGLLPILEDLACAPGNVARSMDGFFQLPDQTKAKLLEALGVLDTTSLTRAERDQLLENTRATLNWINSYGNEDHRLHVGALNAVLDRFAPDDVIERVGWVLRTPWPRLPGGESEDHRVNQTVLKREQTKAAREVLDGASLEEILVFAAAVEYPNVVGYAMALAVRDEEESGSVLDAFLTRKSEMPGLVQAFAAGRVESVGPSWVTGEIARLKATGQYSPEVAALLYLALPPTSDVWDAVSAAGQLEEMAYWKRASGFSVDQRGTDVVIAARKLLQVGRPKAALRAAGGRDAALPSDLVQAILASLATADDKENGPDVMNPFYLGNLFDQLYRNDDLSLEVIAKLEWPFASMIEDMSRHMSQPSALHRLLQRNPQLFAFLVGVLYRRDDREPNAADEGVSEEAKQVQYNLAHHILDSWRLLPGMQQDGSVNETELAQWIEAARSECRLTNHVTGCDLQLGLMLARAPADADGAWPHVAVRNVIEGLRNRIVDQQIEVGILNGRGVVSRALDAGGAQERQLAARYRAQSGVVRAKWPRTAAVLRRIAERYDAQAKQEDIDSDLNDLR